MYIILSHNRGKEMAKFNPKYYINVKEIMKLSHPKCSLSRPKMKPTILVTGWNEWLPIITIEAET